MGGFYNPLGPSGVYDFLRSSIQRRKQGGQGLVGDAPIMGRPTPPNAPVAPTGQTKTETGAPGVEEQRTQPPNPFPSNRPGAGPSPLSAPGIQFSIPSPQTEMQFQGPMTGYGSGPGDREGISAYAGQGGLGNPLMGTSGVGRAGNEYGAQGTPGGGGFSPSQQDWSKVANPEAFDAYTFPIRDAALKAEQVRQQRSIADPMWEEKEKAKIWADESIRAQVGVQETLTKSMTEDYERKITALKTSPDFLALPPEEQQKILASKAEDFRYDLSQLAGRRSASTAQPSSIYSTRR